MVCFSLKFMLYLFELIHENFVTLTKIAPKILHMMITVTITKKINRTITKLKLKRFVVVMTKATAR